MTRASAGINNGGGIWSLECALLFRVPQPARHQYKGTTPSKLLQHCHQEQVKYGT